MPAPLVTVSRLHDRLDNEDPPRDHTPDVLTRSHDQSTHTVADGSDPAQVAHVTAETPPPTMQARDVVAFGREVGRVLSDGRIVGRAEPFAKVFASSRQVKRAVGATAWVILEDIALDATIDEQGRLVADTSVRHIAANLGLNKSTVARHLSRLRDHGFVLHEEARDDASGRWHAACYVLDPSACVERFTHTPAAEQSPLPPAAAHADPVDGADETVSAFTGHGSTYADRGGYGNTVAPAGAVGITGDRCSASTSGRPWPPSMTPA